jgi:hypothetical protein
MTQWHPLFAQLLRPLLEGYYEVDTNVPVGDAPRQADIVLVRRTSARKPPFQGLWKNLTLWNVLEFKGPTVSARLADLDGLVEVGLGIHRRLNEQEARAKRKTLGPEDVSWWYLAEDLGRRFLRDAPNSVGPLEAWGPGVWRCGVLQRRLYLVSRRALPVGEDSLPLHVLAAQDPATEQAMLPVLAGLPALLEQYGPWLVNLHPNLVERLLAMAKAKDKGPQFHLDAVIRLVGAKRVIEEVGLQRVIEELGPKRLIEEIGLKRLLASLTPAERRELKELLS